MAISRNDFRCSCPLGTSGNTCDKGQFSVKTQSGVEIDFSLLI